MISNSFAVRWKPRTRPLLGALLAMAIIVLADFVSKAYVMRHLPLMANSMPIYPYGGIPVFRDFYGIEFSISVTTNSGAAWGMFGDYPQALTAVRGIILTGLMGGLLFLKEPRLTIPYTLILGGAFGNMVDLMTQGFVIDMLHFRFWGYEYPVFNLADCSICIGVFWWMLLSWFKRI